MTNAEEPLKKILESASVDNKQLEHLVASYLSLITSSNQHWIDYYKEAVGNTVSKWRGKYETANALYFIAQGYTQYFLTNYNEALASFSTVFDNCNDTEIFKDIKGLAFMGTGISYRSLGFIDKAMENIILGSKNIDKKGLFREWSGYSYYQLGEIHVFIGEYEKAESFYLEAMDVMKGLETSTPRFRVYDGLGVCYTKMGETNKSFEFLNRALAVDDISPAETSRGLCDLGILYMDNPYQALPYFEESCEIRKKHQLDDAYSTSLIYKGECLLNKKDLNEAAIVLNEALEISERFDVPTKKLHLFKLLSKLYELQKKPTPALKYFHKYDALQVNISSQQVKNIFQLKNRQIAQQHDEIELKHEQLKDTLDQLAKIKVSRRSLFFSIVTVVVLVMSTEIFLDPLIEKYSYNIYLSLGSKVLIAFLLKPIEGLYERLLFRKAVREG